MVRPVEKLKGSRDTSYGKSIAKDNRRAGIRLMVRPVEKQKVSGKTKRPAVIRHMASLLQKTTGLPGYGSW